MLRNKGGRGWQAKAATYVVATTLGAALSGAALGWSGQFISADLRLLTAMALALAATIIAMAQLAGRNFAVLQCNRETPQSWVQLGGTAWALRNGFALGCGAVSRVGFWSWYIVPASALLFADPMVGALVYGVYGAVRGLGACAYLLAGVWLRGRLTFDEVVLCVLSQRKRAQLLDSVQLLALGAAALIALA